MSGHSNKGLPVKGYKPQSDEAVALVNEAKQLEEHVLRFLDKLSTSKDVVVDPRWYSIGRTDIEKGFMAVNRSVFKPTRISLPTDVELADDLRNS